MIKNPSATIALHSNWTESPLNMSRELNPLHHVGDERPAENSTKLANDMPVLVKVVHSHDCSIRQELPHHDEPIVLTADRSDVDVTDPSKPDDSTNDTHSLDIKNDFKTESEHSDPSQSFDTSVEEHKEIAIHDAAPEQEVVTSSAATDIPKVVTATQPKQVVPVQKKERKVEMSNNIFGRLVEQEYGSFAVKASDYSIDEQTRFAKMTVGGILAKKPEEKVDPVAPEFAKIYDSQPIEKEGATNNWDSFATADKTVTPPSFESPALAIAASLDAKKAPNSLSRLLFGERRGSVNDTSEVTPSPPVEPSDSDVFPDEDETVLADLTNLTEGKVVRKKSIIMGAMDLIRGKRKDSCIIHEISKVDEDESSDLDNGGVCL